MRELAYTKHHTSVPNTNEFNLKGCMIGVCTFKFGKFHNVDPNMSHTGMYGIAIGPMTNLNDNRLFSE